MNCDICSKSFTGIVCFQQHEASEKHKRKLKLFQMSATNGTSQEASTSSNNDPQIIHCSVCEISLIGLSSFQEHVNSLQHADMINKKNPKNIVADDQLECTPNESKISEAKKPISQGFNFPSVLAGPYAQCEACQKQFSGPEPYQQHLASETHKKKMQRMELSCNKLDFDTVDSDKINPFSKTQETVALGSNVSATVHPYAECSYCSMKFSGPEPYQLHLDSAGHLKKIAGQQLSSSIQSSENPTGLLGSLRCAICDKDFSGPIPYNQHMGSNVHKKKVQNVEFLKSFISQANPDSTTRDPDCSLQNVKVNMESSGGSNNMWYCEVCNKQSSGPIPHNQHLFSEAHRKKEAQHHLAIKNKLPNGKLNELSKDNQINSNLANFNNSDKTNEFSKDFYVDNDLILCDALKNFGFVPPEDLDVTIFYPDDEIIFDDTIKKSKPDIEVYSELNVE